MRSTLNIGLWDVYYGPPVRRIFNAAAASAKRFGSFSDGNHLQFLRGNR
ncbi:MAG: hypothetical protein ACFFFT_11200 [Candidatus Thorarchaeota archaeon]